MSMTLKLDTPVQFMKGVGPKLGEVLRKKSIHQVQDLLEWYPRAYEDRRVARNIASLRPDETVSLKAQVVRVSSSNLGKSKRKMYEVTLRDDTGRIHCKYFRVPYKGYFERFQPHQTVRVIGKVTHYRGQIEFHHPDIQDVKDSTEGEPDSDRLIPIYPESEGLTNRAIRKMVELALNDLRGEAKTLERFPEWLCEKYQLAGRFDAIEKLHLPQKDAGSEFAEMKSVYHRRVIFEEFFWLELYLAAKHTGVRKEIAPVFRTNHKLIDRLRGNLPFHLTDAQERAFKEIAHDLADGHPMHRLVQGDVGSGKTLVALMAALLAVENNAQAAIMVPTEILAEQHYLNSRKFIEPLGIQVGLLTGSMKTSERHQTYEMLRGGLIQVCVGTHALIQETVEFKNLGLAIIDEQHRFGVLQRGQLKEKGVNPHFLVMTATPIPRTLAMTVYGDLDVSVIDELPPGRSPIQTRLAFDNKRSQVMRFLIEQLDKGRQAYIVYPLVEESEKVDLKNAVDECERLQDELPGKKVGLLHGRMKPEEKDEIMRLFRAAEYDVLVSTTVIEVGVDVPNANLMIIEHAERFGLSQLHQLRGRVGRGVHKSFCILMAGYAVSEESRTRLEILEKTTDGFKIAEADLEIRGPGELLGARQSGLTGFKMANLVRDVKILQEARQAAFEVFKRDPQLERRENESLRRELLRAHGATALASVG
jgi:ATP-dependent DNA helicase RecG